MKNSTFIIFVYFAFTTIGSAQSQAAKQKESLPNDSIINSLITTLDTYYVLSDKGSEMVNVLKKQMKAGAYKTILNPSQLADKLEKDIKGVYPDKHLAIFYDPEFKQNHEANLSDQAKKRNWRMS